MAEQTQSDKTNPTAAWTRHGRGEMRVQSIKAKRTDCSTQNIGLPGFCAFGEVPCGQPV
jgi:hypothetical protein